jgi:hypothetical protein
MFWLADFLHQSPVELVQTLHEEARQQTGSQDPIELCLDVSGWPRPKFLRFVSDLIFAGPSETGLVYEIGLQEAEAIATDFCLNLRMAAALALRVQNFAEAHGMDVDKAIEDWAFWEAGYSGLSNMDDRELGMIQSRIQTLRILYNAGREVLKAQEGKRRGAGRIRVPKSVLSMAPRPPEEMGIRWGAGETPNGWDAKRLRVDAPRPGSFVTHLAAWLALPPEEIVERIARVAEEASPAGYAILGLDAPDTPKDPRGALIFERGSIFLAFIVGETIAHNSIVEASKEKAAELIAEWKLLLRRAAVYAALVGAKAKRRHNSEDWIRLDALATFGFDKEEDAPSEALGTIEEKRSELFGLYETGLFVLEACQGQSDSR